MGLEKALMQRNVVPVSAQTDKDVKNMMKIACKTPLESGAVNL